MLPVVTEIASIHNPKIGTLNHGIGFGHELFHTSRPRHIVASDDNVFLSNRQWSFLLLLLLLLWIFIVVVIVVVVVSQPPIDFFALNVKAIDINVYN